MRERADLNSALNKAADRKTLRSGSRAILFFVVALIAAVGTALLLTRYMEARTAAARVPTETVLVADMDLPIGTELRPEQLRAVAWPVSSLPVGAFKDPKQLEGKVAAVRVYKGEVILPSKLAGAENNTGLSALLPAGMRAVAVRVDDVVGVAGFVHPGDLVDVIATLRTEGSNATVVSKVILQNIKVIAVGKELDSRTKSDKVVPATVATLMVDAEQSERLALGASQGKLLLTLRGTADVEDVTTRGVTANSMLARDLPAPAPAPAAVPLHARGRTRVVKVIPPAEPEKRDVVEIMRGDVFERRTFNKEATR